VPAVQKVRDAAARTQCINNMKQIVLGSHGCHDAYKVFPAGYDNRFTGALVKILPYIDQEAMYDAFNQTAGNYWFSAAANNLPTAAAAPLTAPNNGRWGAQGTPTVFLCPVAPPAVESTWIVQIQTCGYPGVDYPGTLGLADNETYCYNSAPPVGQLGITNYLPCAGYAWEPPNTMATAIANTNQGMYTWNSAVKIDQISDGTSNTIAFLESAGGSASGNNSLATWINYSWVSAICYANFWVCPNPANGNCEVGTNNYHLNYATPGSLHSGGVVNCAYADGTVRGLQPSVSFINYVYLCGYMDAQEVDPTSFE